MTDYISMPRIVHRRPTCEEIRKELGIYALGLEDWGEDFDYRYEVVALDEDGREMPRMHDTKHFEARPYLTTIRDGAMVLIAYCVMDLALCESSLLTWEYE